MNVKNKAIKTTSLSECRYFDVRSSPANGKAVDKAGQQYWNDSWSDTAIPYAIDPTARKLNNWVNLQFHYFFSRVFDKADTQSMNLLEVGCANSVWLPYFSKEFGFEIYGLDYSPVGCQMAMNVLENSGVGGEIVCADFFSPPSNMHEKFDVVVSFGVVEHFVDTAACLSAMSWFLKPGGILITSIPNMVGAIGFVEKILNRPVYDIHQLISPEMLKKEHERAGLRVVECEYFLATNFGVCNLRGLPTNSFTGFLKKILLGVLSRISMVVWMIERKVGNFRPGKFGSPYINCVANKL